MLLGRWHRVLFEHGQVAFRLLGFALGAAGGHHVDGRDGHHALIAIGQGLPVGFVEVEDGSFIVAKCSIDHAHVAHTLDIDLAVAALLGLLHGLGVEFQSLGILVGHDTPVARLLELEALCRVCCMGLAIHHQCKPNKCAH